MPLVFLVVLGAICNFTLLLAMAAGRSRGGWPQTLLLAIEFLLLMAAIVVAILLVIATGIQGKLALGMLAIIGLAAGMVMGGLLTYFEYRLAGRGQSFRTDLRRSMWVGRGGRFRLASVTHQGEANARKG